MRFLHRLTFRWRKGKMAPLRLKSKFRPIMQPVVDPATESTIDTNIVRVELLDPDSYNRPVLQEAHPHQ